MKPYPKNIYQTAALIQKYKDAGLVITDDQKVETALNEIGFYRLRGYSFHLYDNATKKYIPNVTFDTICHIYNFDMELRSLLFGMTCKIEVALRSRFCEALLQKNDALIYLDPSIFKDKAIFWRNTASISSEIARSTDVFITHNYDNHDGQIPLWAAVEVMSFGTLSKYIKNLSTGTDSVYPSLINTLLQKVPLPLQALRCSHPGFMLLLFCGTFALTTPEYIIVPLRQSPSY